MTTKQTSGAGSRSRGRPSGFCKGLIGGQRSHEAAWRSLAAGVVLQAVKDLGGPDDLRALDALMWLADPAESALFLGVLDLENSIDPLAVVSGRVML